MTSKLISPAATVPASKIPPTFTANFADGSTREVQVNFCKNLNCANFGVPASLKKHARRSKAAPSTAGIEYTINTSHGGVTPSLTCRLCGETLPMKSNQGLVEELQRLGRYLETAAEPSCPHEACANHTVPISQGKAFYYSKGKTDRGSQRYACRACGKTFSVAATSTLRQRMSHKNKMLFKLLLGKMPLSRICDAMDISFKTFYDRLTFFHRQCSAFSAKQERRLLEGLSLRRLYVAIDRQTYSVNWSQRKDKRNVMLQAIGSADLESGYVFGMHLNFAPGLDAAEIEADAKAIGDDAKQSPFRRYARLWLEGDYTKAVMASAKSLSKKSKNGVTLGDDISATYQDAESRADVESSDLITSEERFPAKGMQVRTDYTMYAHFYLLRQLFRGVEKVRFYLDQESGIRAACLAAFEQEFKSGQCEAFYVRLAKEMSVDEKQKIIAASRATFKKAQGDNPALTPAEIMILLMRQEMARAATIGKWSDKWLMHPSPNNAEPSKAICYLTDRGNYDEDHLARLYLKASLHAIDRFFMQLRRRLSMLERPIGSASKVGRTWYGYSAYKPENIEKILVIFRVYYNYCLAGEDGKTPAMRLGLAESIVDPQDIIYFRIKYCQNQNIFAMEEPPIQLQRKFRT